MKPFVYCDTCGKEIGMGESAFVREKEDGDIWEQLEREESADLEMWECKECRHQWEEANE